MQWRNTQHHQTRPLRIKMLPNYLPAQERVQRRLDRCLEDRCLSIYQH